MPRAVGVGPRNGGQHAGAHVASVFPARIPTVRGVTVAG
ncbi:hypothetical protein TOK_1222 [Pseudonocardia sp. N23]|nr:hypothetical protein TOK_1222 [Pseudonocardia sp. N23]